MLYFARHEANISCLLFKDKELNSGCHVSGAFLGCNKLPNYAIPIT